MKSAYIIDILRTPVGKFGGTLAAVRPDDLAAHVIKAVLERNQEVAKELIEDVVFGAANQAGEDNRNVARMAALMAGLPVEVGGVTINRLCASGMQAMMDAARAIQCGDGDAMIAGGVESMSRAPFVTAKAQTAFSRHVETYDTTIGWRFVNKKLTEQYFPFGMGQTAEHVAERWHISREKQDEFAFNTQKKYQNAHDSGKFGSELVSIKIPVKKGDQILFDKDEHPRLSTMDKLASLKPAFKEKGTVTAGNSSGINDGAAACLMVSEDLVKRLDLNPIARVVSGAVAGVHPDIMGTGPIPATKKALKRGGLSVNDIGLVELNEAFASQAIVCMEELGLDPGIVNVNGGSIAIGHPLGASGTRISATLLHEMRKSNTRYGLATMCIGVGQGAAMIFEKC